jgi:hypothetical protein
MTETGTGRINTDTARNRRLCAGWGANADRCYERVGSG